MGTKKPPAAAPKKPRSLPLRAWDAWAAFLAPGLRGRDPLHFTVLFVSLCVGLTWFIETYSDDSKAVFHPWWHPHMQAQLYKRDQVAFYASGQRKE